MNDTTFTEVSDDQQRIVRVQSISRWWEHSSTALPEPSALSMQVIERYGPPVAIGSWVDGSGSVNAFIFAAEPQVVTADRVNVERDFMQAARSVRGTYVMAKIREGTARSGRMVMLDVTLRDGARPSPPPAPLAAPAAAVRL